MFWYYIFLVQAYAIIWLLEQQSSLRPNFLINMLLRHLVRIILYTPQKIAYTLLAKHSDLVQRARRIAGNAEFYLEYKWASSIVSSSNPRKMLQRFPYMDCYRSLADIEIGQIRLRAPLSSRILFVGAGPLPLSAILFADSGYLVTTIDNNVEAVSMSNQLIQHLGYDMKIKAEFYSAENFSAYHEYDVVILGALVGKSVQEKEHLILDIIKKSRKNIPILCRSVDGLNEFLYSAVPYIQGEVARVPAVQGKHINSLVICVGLC